MILQLKVSLKGATPPVWRRLLVDGENSFGQLHEILQIAFGWMDVHLHCFDIRKTGSKRVTYPLTIGTGDLDDSMDFDYDGSTEKLSDWLVAEKDRCVYTYNFFEDWEVEILLEKTLPVDEKITYPHCVKAVRVAPGDSSKDLLQADSKELTREINDALVPFSSMPMEDAQPSWPRLLALVDEFKALQPWKWMDDNHIFVVEDPDTHELSYCSIMGGAGLEFGLIAFIGNDGLLYLDKLFEEDIDEDAYLSQRSITLNFSDRNELSREDYELLKEHGHTYKGKKQWPHLRSFKPGAYPWFLNNEEIRMFTIILEQAIIVSKKIRSSPGLIENIEYGYYGRGKSIVNGVWEDLFFLPSNPHQNTKKIPLLVSELEIQQIRKQGKRLNAIIEFGISYAPTPVQEHPEARPYFPTLVLAAERKNGILIFNDTLTNANRAEAIQQSLLKMATNLGGIPRELWVQEDLEPALEPVASKLGIKLMAVKKLPFIKHFIDEMKAYFR